MSLRGSRRPRGRRRCPSSTASATAAMPLRTRSSALCPPPTSGGCRASSGNFSARLRSKPATCSSSPPTGRSPALPESWRPGPSAGGKPTRTTLCACRTPGRLFSTSRRPRRPRDAGRQARLGQGQVRDVSRLSASMSEIGIPSVDKGKHGFGGQKCAHTSSKSLTIQQVFSAAFSSSGHISAPSKLLRT